MKIQTPVKSLPFHDHALFIEAYTVVHLSPLHSKGFCSLTPILFQNELFFLILSSQLLPSHFVNKYLSSNYSLFVLYLKVEFRYQRVVAFRMKQRKENEL